MPGLLIIALVLLLFGVVMLVQSRKDLGRRKRIIDTPTSRIAEAPGSGLVEIKGTIVAGERGLLEAPFSHRSVVWFRVTIEEQRSRGKSSHWVKIVSEADGTVFYVDDGSGQTARVMPSGANVMLDKRDVARSGTWRDAPPELEAFLSSRGLKSTGLLGFNKTLRFEEETLSPGESLYALGPAKREPGPPTHDGAYRTTPTTRLVLEPGDGDAGELILTNKTEEQLVARLRNTFVAGVVMTALGALGLLVAAAIGL